MTGVCEELVSIRISGHKSRAELQTSPRINNFYFTLELSVQFNQGDNFCALYLWGVCNNYMSMNFIKEPLDDRTSFLKYMQVAISRRLAEFFAWQLKNNVFPDSIQRFVA